MPDEETGTAPTVASTDDQRTVLGHGEALPRPQLAGDARAPEDPDEAFPTVDHSYYKIDSELACGGMGRIFTARDRRLGRLVAVKEVIVREEAFLVRFDREVRLTARLQHPGIVSIYEAGRWPSGEPFYAMRLIAGRPLDAVIAEARTLEARRALLPHVLAVAEALAYAHDQRIIHRDLKPANVLVGTYGETVVIDWGLAKDLDAGSDDHDPTGPYRDGGESLTMLGSVMGTPSYMPLEQATGAAVDERADVYAIGALLYQTLAGCAPYEGRTAQAILGKLLHEPPPPLATLAPGVPPDLVAIVDRAMARDAKDRYASAKALAEDLRRYTTGQLVGSHQYSLWELVRRWLRRYRAAVGVATVALLVLVAFGIASYVKVLDEKARANDEHALARAAAARAVEARMAAEHAQAALLVDRARALILDGTPARAAPLLAAAKELGASDPFVTVLEGQIAAAQPAPRWSQENLVPKDSPDAKLTFLDDQRILVGTRIVAAADGSVMPGSPPTDAIARLVAAAGVTDDDPDRISARLDPTGALLVIATSEEVAVWDVATLRKRASSTECAAGTGLFTVAAISPGGDVVGVCAELDNSSHKELVVWNSTRRAKPGEALRPLAESSQFREVVASGDTGTIAAIDAVGAAIVIRDARHRAVTPLPRTRRVAVSADGRFVAAGNAAGYIQIWEVASSREVAVVATPVEVSALAFAPSGQLVAAADRNGTVTVWNLAALLVPVQISDARDRPRLLGAAATARGARWAIATADGNEIVAFDLDGKRVDSLAVPEGIKPTDVVLAAGKIAAAVGRRDKVGVALLRRGDQTIEVKLAVDPVATVGVSMSSDARYLFAGNQILDLATAAVVGTQKPELVLDCRTPRPDRAVCLIDWRPAGSGEDQDVGVFRLPDGAMIEPPKARELPPWPITAVAASKSHGFVGGCDDELAVLDLDTARVRGTIPLGISACARHIAISERTRLGAVALEGGHIVVWDLDTTKPLGTLAAPGDVSALELSASGEYLALATTDGQLAVHHTRSRDRVALLRIADPANAGSAHLAFDLADEILLASVDGIVIRVPWTLPAGAIDPAWRTRSLFVADGLDVRPKRPF